jgi:hypothetical protein
MAFEVDVLASTGRPSWPLSTKISVIHRAFFSALNLCVIERHT